MDILDDMGVSKSSAKLNDYETETQIYFGDFPSKYLTFSKEGEAA